MRQLNYSGIFWTLFSVQWTMFAAAFAFVFLFMWINLRQALRNGGAVGSAQKPSANLSRSEAADRINAIRVNAVEIDFDLSPKLIRSAIVIASLLVAWFAAEGFFSQWDTCLRFRYGGSFGVADPLFGIDVGFYVFHLPFYRLLQTSLMLLTVVTTIGVGVIYVLQIGRGSGTLNRRSTPSHLSVLLFHSGCRLGLRVPPRSL